jgi:hypothetical protein
VSYSHAYVQNYTRVCKITLCGCTLRVEITLVRVEITLMRVKITLVSVIFTQIRFKITHSHKSHILACQNHNACGNYTRACWNHIRDCRNPSACRNYTLRVGVTLERVEITLYNTLLLANSNNKKSSFYIRSQYAMVGPCERVVITIVSDIFTHIRVKITLVSVQITLMRVEITLCVFKSHSSVSTLVSVLFTRIRVKITLVCVCKSTLFG